MICELPDHLSGGFSVFSTFKAKRAIRMKKHNCIFLIITLCLLPVFSRPAISMEKISEDDVISCYTLIQTFPEWQKEKISDSLIQPAQAPYICPKLPYKIYEGRAYKWKRKNTAAQAYPYLCIKDRQNPNRFSFILLTERNAKLLNSFSLGENFCSRLNTLLNMPQWTTFAE